MPNMLESVCAWAYMKWYALSFVVFAFFLCWTDHIACLSTVLLNHSRKVPKTNTSSNCSTMYPPFEAIGGIKFARFLVNVISSVCLAVDLLRRNSLCMWKMTDLFSLIGIHSVWSVRSMYVHSKLCRTAVFFMFYLQLRFVSVAHCTISGAADLIQVENWNWLGN